MGFLKRLWMDILIACKGREWYEKELDKKAYKKAECCGECPRECKK